MNMYFYKINVLNINFIYFTKIYVHIFNLWNTFVRYVYVHAYMYIRIYTHIYMHLCAYIIPIL